MGTQHRRGIAIGANFALGGIPGGNANERNFGALIVDLRSGEVVAVYSPVRGLEGEPSNQAGANTWIKALFDEIPRNVLSEPPINQPPARKYEKHARAGFSVMPPKGWRLTVSGSSCFQRNEGMFESICRLHGNGAGVPGAGKSRRPGRFPGGIGVASAFADTSVRERHLVNGATGPGGAYLLRFDAPAIYYFDHLLPEFEAMVATLKLR